jgi:HK97 family phage portal protein
LFDKFTSALFYSLASTVYSARNGIERARTKSWAELHKFFDTITGVIGTDKKNTQQQLAEFQSWIYIITTTIYSRTSSLGWGLFVDRGTEKKTEINDHPVINLLNKPNPIMSGSFLQQYTQLQLDLTGKAFILKLRNGARLPGELWPVSTADFIRFELGETNKDFLQGYTFKDKNGGTITYPTSEIIYLRYPHPVNFIDGASPVQRMARIVDIEKYVEVYEKTFFENSARPDIILSMKGEAKGVRAGKDANRVLEQWREKHAGPSRFHEPTILSNMEVTTLNATNKDFEFASLAGWTGDMLAAAYSMPKGKLFPEKINRANGFMIEQTFNRDCIAPRINLWDESMTNDLATEFDDRLIVEHENPVPADQTFDLKKDESDLKNLVNTVNEVRERRGQKRVKWGDIPWAPFNLVQIDGNGEIREPEPKETPDNESEKSKIVTKNRFLDSEEKRVNYWKQFDRRTENQANQFRKTLRKLFSQQENEVLGNLKRVAPKLESKFNGWRSERIAFEIKQDPKLINDILFDQEEWEAKFAKGGKPHIKNAVDVSGKSVMVDLGVDATFNVNDPIATEFIKDRSLVYAKQVNVTTRKKLRRTLAEGFKQGESIPKLSRRIRDVYDAADKTRSVVIARTEVIGASNFGSWQGMKQSKVVQNKEWLTSKDDRVRDAHEFMDGVIVEINELFDPGDGSVQYPESINERCTVVPYVSTSP